jgi:hypothetical protein
MNSSRREALKLGVAALAGACVASRAAAQAKASKQAMQYQDQPKNDAQGQCKVVDGPISPKGYCVAFVKKS